MRQIAEALEESPMRCAACMQKVGWTSRIRAADRPEIYGRQDPFSDARYAHASAYSIAREHGFTQEEIDE